MSNRENVAVYLRQRESRSVLWNRHNRFAPDFLTALHGDDAADAPAGSLVNIF
ncbi:MAG: hypothetical protein Q8O48_02580 [Anaerolineales bacterium]|nr:hypothetical protein [Anaerolineales bacterium]